MSESGFDVFTSNSDKCQKLSWGRGNCGCYFLNIPSSSLLERGQDLAILLSLTQEKPVIPMSLSIGVFPRTMCLFSRSPTSTQGLQVGHPSDGSGWVVWEAGWSLRHQAHRKKEASPDSAEIC